MNKELLRLQCFLYNLGRDHLPLGQLEESVRGIGDADTEYVYSNTYLANWAWSVAERILDEVITICCERSPSEVHALRSVIAVGDKLGYGNLIDCLRRRWAFMLMDDYDMSEASAKGGAGMAADAQLRSEPELGIERKQRC